MTVTEMPRLARDVPESERMMRAVRAAGRSIKAGGVTSAILGDGQTSRSAAGQIKRLFDQYKALGYQLPWEVLDYVELLATYNPDYSQAVENIKMLANSGHELIVSAASDLQQRKTKAFLEEKARKIQESHGGIDGVIEKLLDQAATYGAMCGEWVLSDDLREVIDFVDLNPKKIRFFWLDDEERYAPFQKVTMLQAKEAEKRGQEVRNNCVRLNELTFCYYAFDAEPESPYGTPPFLAALANIAIQRDMVHNMAQIVKKIGLLGIVDLTIERLEPRADESDDDYAIRAAEYLEEYIAVAEAMVKDGGVVHFDDMKATAWQIGGNAAGATNIHKANEEMVFSGLKSMPSVQGRSYSTTETYAGVAYEIILRNTYRYQRAVKRVIERGYWLMVTMAGGMQPDSISLDFKNNRSLFRMQEASAESTEINNAFVKWMLGILNQQGVANELGYASPATEMSEPPETMTGILSAHMVNTLGGESPARTKGSATLYEGEESSDHERAEEAADRAEQAAARAEQLVLSLGGGE